MSPNQFLLAMFAITPICSAHIGGQLLSAQELSPKTRVYCGRALARMIATICNDDTTEVDKRSQSGTMYGAMIPPYYKEQETHVGWPWMPSSRAIAMGSNRGKRIMNGGIADECCDKPCSISELLYYC